MWTYHLPTFFLIRCYHSILQMGRMRLWEVKHSLPCTKLIHDRMYLLIHNSLWLFWLYLKSSANLTQLGVAKPFHPAAASCLHRGLTDFKGTLSREQTVLTFWLREKKNRRNLSLSVQMGFLLPSMNWNESFTWFFISLKMFGLYVRHIPNQEELELKFDFLP